jgi:predicted permease
VSRPRPPRFAQWLLERWLDPAAHEAVAGDLEEEYHARAGVTRHGNGAWFYWQAIRSIVVCHAAGHRPRSQGDSVMTTIMRDVSYAARQLAREPGFAAVLLVTISLGIGGATAIFSVVHAVLLRPLPYHDESRIVMVWETEPAAGVAKKVGTPGNFQDWRAQTRTIDHLGALLDFEATLTGRGEPRRVKSRRVNASVFTALGVQPLIGRPFIADDEDAGNDAVLLAHHTWQELFGADPHIVGQRITLNDQPRTVIGVMGPGFRLPRGSDDLWIPLVFNTFERQARGSHRLLAIGRLKPGVTLPQAQADMDTIATQLAVNFPVFNAREGLLVEPIREEMSGELQRPLTIVMAAVLMVMLIASINVANLLLARAYGRQPEIAVRLALGAPRRRLVRQLLTESTFLSGLGCLGGIALAAAAVGTLRSSLPPAILATGSITLNLPILAFGVTLALIGGLLFGMAPVLLLSSQTGSEALNDSPRGSSSARTGRMTRVLVGAEISLAVVLLVVGGLLIRSFTRLVDVDTGFRSDAALTFKIELPRSRYPGPTRWGPALDDLMARLEALPGVRAAGAISWLPLTTSGGSNALFVEGRPLPGPGEQTYVVYRVVTPDYFRTLGIPLREGRVLDISDGANAPRGVVINETMARKYWPGASPLGRRVSFARKPREEDWMTVVGVVGDTKQFALNEPVDIEMFAAHSQEANWFPPSHVVVRTSGDPLALVSAVRAVVRGVDPLMPVSDIKTLETVVSDSVAPARFGAVLIAAFASVSLVLAAIGVYGLLSFTVASRTREIGVRTALGADKGTITKMIVRDGIGVAAVGLAIGLAAALSAGRLLRSFLFETAPTDMVTLTSITAILSLVVLAACYVPARRAARIDPVKAIRN